MGKKYIFIQVIFLACVLLPGQTAFDVNQRWINPGGWKIPDLSRLAKSSEKQAGIFGHDQKILVETYESPKQEYSFFDKKVAVDAGRYLVYLDCEVRVQTDIVQVYKDQKGNVLLYFINCMLPEHVVANDRVDGFHNAGYSSSASQYILVDLDNDGKFESQFTETTEFWNDVTERGVPTYFQNDHDKAQISVVYNLLQIKLSGKKIGIPRQANQ